jgi:heme oxygenase
MIYWTGTTLVALLKNPVGQARVKKILQDLTDKGETILNTNIPQEFYPTK